VEEDKEESSSESIEKSAKNNPRKDELRQCRVERLLR